MGNKTVFKKNQSLPANLKFTNNTTGKSVILNKKSAPAPVFRNGRIQKPNLGRTA